MNTISRVQKVHGGIKERAVVLVYSEGKYLSSDRRYSAFIQPLSELDYYKSPPGYRLTYSQGTHFHCGTMCKQRQWQKGRKWLPRGKVAAEPPPSKLAIWENVQGLLHIICLLLHQNRLC